MRKMCLLSPKNTAISKFDMIVFELALNKSLS
jgi:hypothetical protein